MPTRALVTPDGVSLFVNELGSPGHPPVVVLHGGPAAHHDYLLPAFARLADFRRVVLYDQRGGGRSRAPAGVDLGFSKHLDDLDLVLGERADLVGYSFGALIAMVFAARHPGRIGRLALVAAAPPWAGYRTGLDRALTAAQSSPWMIAERAALEASGLRETQPQEYRRRRFSLSVAGYFVDPRLAYALTPFHVQTRTAQAISASLGDYDFRDEVAGLDGARTLFLHGELDPVDIAFTEETACRCGARVERLAGSGHLPYLEAAEPFFSILRAFLGGPP